jgi:5-methylcytosine-specific restriction endonuclease McrA
MRLCKIEGCNRTSKARGLCNMHYYRDKKGIKDLSPFPLSRKEFSTLKSKIKCNIDGCLNDYFANGFCHNHYELNRRNGIPGHIMRKEIKCSFEGCNEFATRKFGLCSFHLGRKRNGIPLEIPRGKAFSGKRNPRWNGGVADYPNHSEMKRIRKIVLEEENYTCHYCGKHTKRIHHIDLSKDNHKRENLTACCNSCNLKRAKKHKKHSSKYRRLYGYDLKELAEMRKLIKRVRKDEKIAQIKSLNRTKVNICVPVERQVASGAI